MSTPAQNTRLRTKSTQQHLSDRDQRQVLKQTNHEQSVMKKNELVKSWLAASHGLVTIQGRLNQTEHFTDRKSIDSWAISTRSNKKGKNPFDSELSSEVIFNKKQVLRASSINMEEETEDNSILFGESAMSGHSSTARRRAQNARKIEEISNMHSKVSKKAIQRNKSQNDHDHIYTGGSQSIYNTASQTKEAESNQAETNEIGHSQHDQSYETSQNKQVQKSATDLDPAKDEQGDGSRTEEEPKQKKTNSEEAEPEDEIDLSIIDRFKKRLDEQDSTVFYDMFKLIITKLSTVQQSIKKVKLDQQGISDKVSLLEKNVNVLFQTIDDYDAEVEDVNETNVKLIQAVIKNERDIVSTKNELEKLHSRINRGCFILKGLILKKDDEVKDTVSEFLKNKLKIEKEVKVVSAHKMGNAKYAPIWFQVEDPDDIAIIYKQTSNLKDVTNAAGKKYSVRSYSSEQQKEKSTRQQDIVMENKRLPESHKLEMAYNRGELMVNGEQYKKEVESPSSRDILLMKREEEIEIEKHNFHETPTRSENGSFFKAYGKEANTVEEVQEMYQAIRAKHLSSTHIMCGYRIFGSSFHLLQDHVSDGEWGGSRYILEAIKNAKVWNFAVFIVRYHNGPNLGKLRFDIVADLTRDLISGYPKALNYGQFFTDQITLGHYNTAAERPERPDGKANNTPQSRGRRPRYTGRRGTRK